MLLLLLPPPLVLRLLLFLPAAAAMRRYPSGRRQKIRRSYGRQHRAIHKPIPAMPDPRKRSLHAHWRIWIPVHRGQKRKLQRILIFSAPQRPVHQAAPAVRPCGLLLLLRLPPRRVKSLTVIRLLVFAHAVISVRSLVLRPLATRRVAFGGRRRYPLLVVVVVLLLLLLSLLSLLLLATLRALAGEKSSTLQHPAGAVPVAVAGAATLREEATVVVARMRGFPLRGTLHAIPPRTERCQRRALILSRRLQSASHKPTAASSGPGPIAAGTTADATAHRC